MNDWKTCKEHEYAGEGVCPWCARLDIPTVRAQLDGAHITIDRAEGALADAGTVPAGPDIELGIRALTEERDGLKAELEEVKADAERLRDERDTERAALVLACDGPDLEGLSRQCVRITARAEKAEQERDAALRDAEVAWATAEVLGTERDATREDLNDAREVARKRRTDLDAARELIEEQASDLRSAHDHTARLIRERDAAQADLEAVREEAYEAIADLAEAQGDLKTARGEVARLKQDVTRWADAALSGADAWGVCINKIKLLASEGEG